MLHDHKELLKAQIVGLSMKCPFDGTNPCVCPLHEIRKQSLTERFAWVQKLSEEEALEIVTNHQACLLDKETSGGEESGGSPGEIQIAEDSPKKIQGEPLSEWENV